MKQKALFIALVIIVAIAACKKEKSNVLPPSDDDGNTIDTLIPNFSSTRLENNELESNLYLRDVILGYSSTWQSYLTSYKASSNYDILVNYNCATGKLDIPEQIVQTRIGGLPIYCTVTGTGERSLNGDNYEITYTSRYKDGGNNVYLTYKIIAAINKL